MPPRLGRKLPAELGVKPTDRVALAAAWLMPLCLLSHFKAGMEICIFAVDALFFVHLAATRGWAALRQGWFAAAMAWWLWEVVCSVPVPAFGFGVAGWAAGFVQAVVLLRLIVFAAALQNWVLTTPQTRHAAYLMLALCCLWIGLESWAQYLTGSNIFGDHRWPDGALTGPFRKPEAGAPFSHLLCAAMLPAVLALLKKPQVAARILALGLPVAGLATTVLIGQRMPTVLAILALGTCALLIPKLRPAAVIALVTGLAVVAATPVISPPTYAKLVVHFSQQMRHFALSPYGELYTRALTIARASPWHGNGFAAFRTLCPWPQYGTGFPAFGIAPTTLALQSCNLHPHNFYLQALTDGGLPGVLLFAAANLALLIAMARGLWRQPDPLRVGLFAGVLTYAWPLASTDSFATLPMAGWLVYMAGLGLAASQITPEHILPEAKNV